MFTITRGRAPPLPIYENKVTLFTGAKTPKLIIFITQKLSTKDFLCASSIATFRNEDIGKVAVVLALFRWNISRLENWLGEIFCLHFISMLLVPLSFQAQFLSEAGKTSWKSGKLLCQHFCEEKHSRGKMFITLPLLGKYRMRKCNNGAVIIVNCIKVEAIFAEHYRARKQL